jgi:hypothetical protein
MPMLGHRRLTTFLAAAIVADTVQELLNSQKLSLPANTPLGTRVKVTDGFVVSGTGAPDGFYAPGPTVNGRTSYVWPSGIDGDGNGQCFWTGIHWLIQNASQSESGDDVAAPWLVAIWGDLFTLTHPAVQELTAPSTAQGGVFVSGGTQDGIYVVSVAVSPLNGRNYYLILGTANIDDTHLNWTGLNTINDTLGHGPSSPGWLVSNTNTGDYYYYSLSDTATPDLASNWKNANDDSPASITVSNVTQGELDAGMLVSGAGTEAVNGSFVNRNTILSARPSYGHVANPAILIKANDLDDVDVIDINGSTPYATNEAALFFPWIGTWTTDTGTPPAPTVTRDDVASEANWSNV